MRKEGVFSLVLVLFLAVSISVGTAIAVSNIGLDLMYPSGNISVIKNLFFNVTVNVSCSGDECGVVNVTLDPAPINYTFTTCGASGRFGPNQSQCNSNYTNTTLSGLVTVGNGTQYWTVPTTGTYNIEVGGARGGNGTPTYVGGNGSRMIGNFSLVAGQQLKILIGQKGGDVVSYKAGGGGGGSFVAFINNTPLIVAGGGSGGGGNTNPGVGQGGRNVTSGGNGTQGVYAGGLNGLGGGANSGTGGGAGFTGNGNSTTCSYINMSAISFVNNGTGGPAGFCAAGGGAGGFGGGSGGEWCCQGASGAGGGYSGGGGTNSAGVAGAGGSYNSGTEQVNIANATYGDGYVIISAASGKNGVVSMSPTATPFYTNVTNPYNINLSSNQSQLITWWVNASGSFGAYNFVVYANQTTNQSVNNRTVSWYITIYDPIAPNVTLVAPTNASEVISAAVSFNVSVSDNVQLANATLYIWNATNEVINTTLSSVITTVSGINTSVALPYAGLFKWNYYVCDSSGNCAFASANNSVSYAPPQINVTLLTPIVNSDVTRNQLFTVSVNVSCTTNDCGQINVTLDPITPWSCKDVLDMGVGTVSGRYNITPGGGGAIEVYCDLVADGGGWTLVGTIGDPRYLPFVTNNLTLNVKSPNSTTTWFHANYSLINGTEIRVGRMIGNGTNTGDFLQINDCGLNDSGCWYGVYLTQNDGDTFGAWLTRGGTYYAVPSGCSTDGCPATNGDRDFNQTFRVAIWGGDCHSTCNSGGNDTKNGFVYRDYGTAVSPSRVGDRAYWSNWTNNTGSNVLGTLRTASDYGLAGTMYRDLWIRDTAPSGTKGVVSNVVGATPFYADIANPYNITLNENQSAVITWQVNATGSLNSTYTFFVFANVTSDMSVQATSILVNLTIINQTINDTTPPSVSVSYPTNTTYDVNVSALNYSHTDNYPGYCWYSTNSGVTNSTPVVAGINFTGVVSSEGSNSWRVYCNDSTGNQNSSSVTFVKAVPSLSLSLITPTTNMNATRNQFFEVKVNVSCSSNNNCGQVNVTLDPESTITYNFTTCGASGRTGPNQSQCNAAYNGTSLQGLVNVTDGVQNWTVPATGTYLIKVWGAQGGKGGASYAGNRVGGLGAKMEGTFELTQGTVLQILVGQTGVNDTTYGGGGGGGSFVTNGSAYTTATPMIIAGGGGGGGVVAPDNSNASINSSGNAGGGSTPGAGGSNGTGGASDTSYGGGGGGFYSNATAGDVSGRGGGFRYGAKGGVSRGAGGLGGFGGGGTAYGGAGGGGGYSGGGGGDWSSAGFGGGGGSYNNGTSQLNVANVTVGNGLISISRVSSAKGGTVSTVAGTTPFYTNVTNPYNVTINAGTSTVITWYVNATGDIGASYPFFIYANRTADLANNVVSASWNVTIVNVTVNDTNPPTIIFVVPSNNSFITNAAQDINFTAIDSVSSVSSCWYSNDSMSVNTTLAACTNITSVVWSEGQHNVTVWSNDSRNNIGASYLTFSIDTIIPLVSVVLPGNNTNNSNAQLSINYTVIDVNRASCWYSNDSMSVNASLASCANITSVIWKEGKHNVTIYANDSAGNLNRSFVVFTIDSRAPNMSVGGPSNNTITTNANVNFSINSTDQGQGLANATLSIYNQTGLYNQTTVSIGGLTSFSTGVVVNLMEGVYRWFWSVVDLVGNTATSQNNTVAAAGNYSVTYDAIPPGIAIAHPVSNVFTSNTAIDVNYSVFDATSGVGSCWYSNDSRAINTTLASCANLTAIVWSNGQHNVTVWANDTAGNKNSSSVSFTVDIVSPSLTIATASGLHSTDTGFDVSYIAVDTNRASCWFSNDSFAVNTSLASCSNITSVVWAEGLHTVRVYVNDSASNENMSVMNFTVDLTSPSASITFPTSPNQTSDSTPDVRFNITDNLAQIVNYTVFVNSVAVNTSGDGVAQGGLEEAIILTSSLSLGEYNISVAATDSAGNKRASADLNLTIVPPAVYLQTPLYNSFLNYKNVTFSFIVADPTSASLNCSFYLDGALNQSRTTARDVVSNFTVNNLGDHAGYVWSVLCVNPVNATANDTFIVNVDTLVPQVSLFSPANNTNTSNSQLNVNFTRFDVTSSISSCWFSNDSFAVNTSLVSCGNITSIAWAEGDHNVRVYVNDSANNLNTASVRFTIDSRAPNITTIGPSNNTVTTVTDVNFSATVIDSGLGVVNATLSIYNRTGLYNRTTVNIGNLPSFTPSVVVTLVEGVYNWFWSVVDVVANVATSQNETANFGGNYTVTYDPTSPSISIVLPSNNSFTSNADMDVNYSVVESTSLISSCWYSVDTFAANTTLSGCDNLSAMSWFEGVHNVRVYVNDSANNQNVSSVKFTIDTISPSISIVTTEGLRTSNANLFVTFMALDTNRASCWYSNDSMSVNTSLASCGNITSVVWEHGEHTVMVYVNDSANNVNNASVVFTIDSQAPYFTNIPLATDVSYLQSFGATFEAADDDRVTGFMTNTTQLQINATGFLTNATTLGAGTYNVNVTVNDTSNNVNSVLYTVSVNAVDPGLALSFSPGNNVTYGLLVTAQGGNCPSQIECKLNRNNTGTISNGEALTLGAGVYNYTYNTTGNANYTSAVVSDVLVVNQAASVVNLRLNGSASNVSIAEGDSISLNGTIGSGDPLATLQLYNNGVLINQAATEVSNLTTFSAVGAYNVTVVYVSSQNYTGSSTTYWVNVGEGTDRTAPSVTIVSPENTTFYSPRVWINVSTNENATVWYALNGGVNVSLTANSSGTGFTGFNHSLRNGQYNLTVYARDVLNNTGSAYASFVMYGRDTDNDGIIDLNDTLTGNATDVLSEGLTDVNVTVGASDANGTFNGTYVVTIRDGASMLVNFTHNFTATNLTLSRVTVLKGDNYLVLNFSDQLQGNKTVFFEDNNFIALCVKDADVSAITDLSSSCDGAGELDFTSCIGASTSVNVSGISCYDEGEFFRIENLVHSAMRGTVAAAGSNSTGSSGGHSNRGAPFVPSNEVCDSGWDCTSWSLCDAKGAQVRTCVQRDPSCDPKGIPSELRSCPDILFDVKVDMASRILLPWDDVVFMVDLDEVTSEDMVDVVVQYHVLNASKDIVFEESETVAVSRSLRLTKKLADLNLPAGTYFIEVVVRYGKGQEASSLVQFRVIDAKKTAQVGGVMFVIVLAVVLLVRMYKKRKLLMCLNGIKK